jgi:hypothetical protein
LTTLGSLRLLSARPPVAAPAKAGRLRRGVAGVAAATILLGGAGHAPPAAAGTLHLRCTNAASGASWPLAVDLDRSRVDSLPATITKKWISWHDPQAGFFDLERDTGQLQLRNASSTGGYFLHYFCRPD